MASRIAYAPSKTAREYAFEVTHHVSCIFSILLFPVYVTCVGRFRHKQDVLSRNF